MMVPESFKPFSPCAMLLVIGDMTETKIRLELSQLSALRDQQPFSNDQNPTFIE